MSNKHPEAVVTDGDGAMREAIKEIFPKASHQLCAWHLQRNACENVKNPLFLQDFKSLIYSNFTREEFEEKWNEVTTNHGLSSNKWVMKTYENKEMWATANLREKFFGHIRTTSQCEGINSLIKNYVKKKSSLVDFMHNFHEALMEYRNNELISDFNCMYSTPVLTTSLPVYEKQAVDIFTRNIFKEVKCEIEEACAMNLTDKYESGDHVVFKMNLFGRPKSLYQVTYDKEKRNFLYDCRLFESRGIPCSHILSAMKHDHFDNIPKSLICKRWTRDAKSDYISTLSAEVSDARKTEIIGFGALASLSNRLCNIASTNVDDFMEIRDEIYNLIIKLERKRDPQSKQPSTSQLVPDPTIVKTKGAPNKKKYGCKKRRCSKCNKHGHTIRRCPLLFTEDDPEMEIDRSCSDSGKTKSDDKKSNDFGYETNEEELGFGPINNTHMQKVVNNIRTSKPKKIARSKSDCPTRDSNKEVTRDTCHEIKRRKSDLVHNGPLGNIGPIGEPLAMNPDIGIFPPYYSGMPTCYQYPLYPVYGGARNYRYNLPYYFDPKFENSGAR